ncbi:MAG: HesA/MoeB/ThiF family protein, partial [Cobetia amphilecti]
MQDSQLLRYSRQILLPQVDIAGQQRLLAARVLVIGAGGLGCPAALYLAAAGIGTLVVADDDHVELSNLQRQIAHGDADIDQPKAQSLAASLLAINPDA